MSPSNIGTTKRTVNKKGYEVMSAVEAEGSTIDEAVHSALKELGVERDNVEIEVIKQPTRGFLGIGSRKARVRATLRKPVSFADSESHSGRRKVSKRSEPRRTQRRSFKRDPDTLPAPVSKETAEKARGILSETLRLMKLEVPVSTTVHENEPVVNLDDTLDGLLIGRKGQTLDALEYLINRMISQGEDEAHLTIDAEGYRDRRRQSLESLALRLSERAKRRKKTVTLNALTPRDRRVVHLILEEDPLVSTRSVGRGHFRRLSIVPEGVPDSRRESPKDTRNVR